MDTNHSVRVEMDVRKSLVIPHQAGRGKSEIRDGFHPERQEQEDFGAHVMDYLSACVPVCLWLPEGHVRTRRNRYKIRCSLALMFLVGKI